ncbi:MAG: addiction module toxin RelE [Candidatus Tectomicrobia bacterium RIFCSPLOWO2_12_FULL_69_37]|nr:MAG: addiction module toxin RelE [Candidatus Tectomicrobia bacterium RIFCSPLOWO2_12_FULL_69_37]
MVGMRDLIFLGDSLKRFRRLPQEVQDDIAFALIRAQEGKRHDSAKPLKGFGGASVLEVAEDHNKETYRAVYTTKFEDAIYVLHVFQKKSKRGIETPRNEMEIIISRLKALEKEQESGRKRK